MAVGFNKLNGMVIVKYKLETTGDYSIVGSVVIPNPTVFTLQVVCSRRLSEILGAHFC